MFLRPCCASGGSKVEKMAMRAMDCTWARREKGASTAGEATLAGLCWRRRTPGHWPSSSSDPSNGAPFFGPAPDRAMAPTAPWRLRGHVSRLSAFCTPCLSSTRQSSFIIPSRLLPSFPPFHLTADQLMISALSFARHCIGSHSSGSLVASG